MGHWPQRGGTGPRLLGLKTRSNWLDQAKHWIESILQRLARSAGEKARLLQESFKGAVKPAPGLLERGPGWPPLGAKAGVADPVFA